MRRPEEIDLLRITNTDERCRADTGPASQIFERRGIHHPNSHWAHGLRARGQGLGRPGSLYPPYWDRLGRKPRPNRRQKSGSSPRPCSSPPSSPSPPTTPACRGHHMLTCSPSSATEPLPFRPLALQRARRAQKAPLQIYVAGAPPRPLGRTTRPASPRAAASRRSRARAVATSRRRPGGAPTSPTGTR